MAKKSKSCWECHRRRLVCDLSAPECRKCQVRGVTCPGYGSKPLKWVPPQQVKSKQHNSGKEGKPTDENREQIAVPQSLPGDTETTNMFEAVEYFNAQIAPDLVATGQTGPSNMFFVQAVVAPMAPRACIQSLVCTALCHRLLQTTSRPASEKAVLTTRLHKHRGEAIQALSLMLSKPGLQVSDPALASVLTLLLAEIQQTFSQTWHQHVTGASTIITLRGGLSSLIFRSPRLRHLLRYYAIVDVLGTTTSPLRSTSTPAPHQLPLLPLLPILYGNGLGTCFPCPPTLFAQLIHINHLRLKFHHLRSSSTQSFLELNDRDIAGMDVLQKIRGYDVQSWALSVAFDASGGVGRDQGIGFGGWMAVGRVFQCAVGIYCVAGLFGHVRGVEEAEDELSRGGILGKMRRSGFEVLVQQLRVVRGYTQLRKLVMWPLVVAGIETDNEEIKGFVLDELAWITQTVGIAAPLLARQFLRERVWGIPVERRKWDDLFDRPYLFAV